MHLHLIEPRPDGHRMQYVRRLIEQAPADWQLSLSTFPSSLEHPGTLAALTASGGRLRLLTMARQDTFEAKIHGAGGFSLQPAYWRLFQRHWASLTPQERGDLVVVPYLDYCSYAIGLLGSPFGDTRFGGILMRPDFHWAEQGVVAPPVRHVRFKRWLFLRLLRHPNLHRLVTIDPSLRDWVTLHRPSSCARLRYADDPADLRGAGDKAHGRRHFGVKDDAFVLLVFGSIDQRKGLGALLDIAGHAQFPSNGQVLIVGQQSAQAQSLIAERSARLPINRVVCVDRYVDSNEEWLAFAAADACWLAYDNFFGSSGVLAQCAQAGLPVVYRRVGIVGYSLAPEASLAWAWLAGSELSAAPPRPPGAHQRPLGQVFLGDRSEVPEEHAGRLAEPRGAGMPIPGRQDGAGRLKSWSRRLLGSQYDRLRQFKNSDAVRTAVATAAVPLNWYLQKRNRNHFVFEVAGQMGLGGMLTHVVKLVKYCDDKGLTPVVRFTNPLYASTSGEDWFGRLFVNKKAADADASGPLRALVVRNEKSYLGFKVEPHFPMPVAHKVFFSHLEFRREIVDICDGVMKTVGRDRFDMALHYRGTDKLLEAETVEFEDFSKKLDELLALRPNVKTVFLATDTHAFDVYIRSRFPALLFFTYNLDAYSATGMPRHFSSLSGDLKAVEALVNMILISRSEACIRTASYLSAWSKIFNPDLKTWTLNRLHKTTAIFPEHEIAMEEALYASTPTN